MTVRRRRRVSRVEIFFGLVALVAMIGGSLWLDLGHDPVLSTVTGKTEEVRVSHVPRGAWHRKYLVGTTFTTAAGGSFSATVALPSERFDALEPGDTLRIRYLEALPFFARAADRSTVMALRDAGARLMTDQVLAPMLLWAGAGFVVLWLMRSLGIVAILAAGAAWIAAAFPLIFPARTAPPPGPGESRARVAAISLVDRAPDRRVSRRRRIGRNLDFRRLKVPYQVVQLRLAVPGRADSVLAVDAVDSGSVPGLAHGALVPVRYDPRLPRAAQLAQGTRTYLARNRYHFVVPVVGVGLLAVMVTAGWRTRSARARQKARPAAG